MSLKLTLALPGGALTNFPCKLHLKNFSPPWGAGAPTAPVATPMIYISRRIFSHRHQGL